MLTIGVDLVDPSYALVKCIAKQHENCDIFLNERPFHLCIVCFKPIGAQHFERSCMHVHSFLPSTVFFIERLGIQTNFRCIWVISSITYPKPRFNIQYRQNFIHVLKKSIRSYYFVFLGESLFCLQFLWKIESIYQNTKVFALARKQFPEII